jgi:hypothetical protein
MVALEPIVAPPRTRVGAEFVLKLDLRARVGDVGEHAGGTAEHVFF